MTPLHHAATRALAVLDSLPDATHAHVARDLRRALDVSPAELVALPALPRTAAEVRDFIGDDFISINFGAGHGTGPHESDVYELSAHDLISAFARLAAAPQPAEPAAWIPVTERMPEPDSGEVLVWLSGGMYALEEWHTYREDPTGMSTTHTLDMGVMWRHFDFEEVTHWMPLPPAPGAVPQPQPAEPVVTVRFDLSPAMVEGAIRDKLIELGWTPPTAAPAEPVAWRPAWVVPSPTWNDGPPRQQDIDYYTREGIGIEYAYAAPQPQRVPLTLPPLPKHEWPTCFTPGELKNYARACAAAWGITLADTKE